MNNKKFVYLAILNLFTILLLSTFSFAVADNPISQNDLDDEEKSLPLSNWNESKLSEFHYSPQIKTKLNDTFFPLQSIIGGSINKTDKNKTWDNINKSIFHYANDIKVYYENESYSLQYLINYRGIKVKGGADFPAVMSGSIPLWDYSNHIVWHNADEIRVNIKKNFYSLQYAIDQGLIKFPSKVNKTKNITILEFTIREGNKEDYVKSCTYRRGESNVANYIEKINASKLISGVIYDFTCSYGDSDQKIKKRVQFNDSFVEFYNADEDHISRIIKFLNREIIKGKDTFIWEGKLENGELNVRVRRAENCREGLVNTINPLSCNFNRELDVSPEAFRNAGLLERFFINSLRNEDFNNDDRVNWIENWKGSERITREQINCLRYPTSTECNNLESTDTARLSWPEILSHIDCSGSGEPINNLKCAEFNFCPIYKVPTGIGPGIVRNQEVYAWKEVNCEVKINK